MRVIYWHRSIVNIIVRNYVACDGEQNISVEKVVLSHCERQNGALDYALLIR